jgi:raffinose/stachyose/melibiose transport system substrate-binding protein
MGGSQVNIGGISMSKFRSILAYAIVAILVAATFGCSDGGGSAGSGIKNTTIVFWNSGYPTIDANNKSKTREEFYIVQAVKRFEEANPGIKVDLQDTPGGEELFTKFQAASIAKNGPDIAVIWSGNYLLRFKQFLEPMNAHFSKDERSRISGWESVSEDFKDGNKAYGVPFSSDGVFGLYYNKKLMANAGVDLEKNPPKNFNQFVDVLQKLKDSGTIPLGYSATSGFWFIPSYWIAQTYGVAGVNDLATGKRKFTDPKFEEIAKAWNTLYARGFTNTDQAATQFTQGKIAMMAGGPTSINNFRKGLGNDLGMIKVPNFREDVAVPNGGVGGVGRAYAVPNYSKNKAEALKFIKFLMSKEEQTLKVKSGESGALPSVKDVPIESVMSDPISAQISKWANEPSAVFWPDNIYPAELAAEIVAQQQLLQTGKLSAAEFLQKIDKKRDDIVKSSK